MESEALIKQLEQAQESLKWVQEDTKAALDAQAVKMEDALQRAAERAEIEKERAVLAAQRETMNEIGKLRENLARSREEKAALEVLIARAGGQQPEAEQPVDGKV